MTPVFDPMRLSAVSLDVLAAARSGADAIADRQRKRLARVVQGARRDSAFYREHLRDVSPDAPLAALPVVNRRELMENFDRWVTDPSLTLAGLQAFTADPARLAQAFQGRYVVWESSGTSGQPGIFVQDAQAMAVYDALEALRRDAPRPQLRWLDPLYLNERIAFVGATGGHFASVVSIERLRQINPWMARAVHSFSILQPLDRLVDQLNAFAPTVIATYPSAAAYLAEQSLADRFKARVREVWTGGETLSPSVRRHIERSLGCTVRNSYGASEFLTLGWECGQGALHLNADWAILEPVDASGQPVAPGELSDGCLLTHLANSVQPLIRYDLGDQIRLRPQPCACGSPLPVIEVQGRRDEPLVMRGLRGRRITLLPMALTTVLEEEAGVFDFHVRQIDEHSLALRLPLSGEAATAAMARCRAALQAYAAGQGMADLQVVAETGEPMPLGRSGKACRVAAAQRKGAHRPD